MAFIRERRYLEKGVYKRKTNKRARHLLEYGVYYSKAFIIVRRLLEKDVYKRKTNKIARRLLD